MSVTVMEDARAMRRAKGRHTISASEYAALVGPLRVAGEPPDGYALALDAQRRTAALVSAPPTSPHEPPDGYQIALDKQRGTSTAPVPAPTASNQPLDGYALALDKQRKGK